MKKTILKIPYFYKKVIGQVCGGNMAAAGRCNVQTLVDEAAAPAPLANAS